MLRGMLGGDVRGCVIERVRYWLLVIPQGQEVALTAGCTELNERTVDVCVNLARHRSKLVMVTTVNV